MPALGCVPAAAARSRTTASPLLLRLGVLAIISCAESLAGASNETQPRGLAAVAHSERDCSHLKGRLYGDCRCRAALPRVRAVWEAGEVMAAVAATEACDRSSPGLDSRDRILLNAVYASASRVRTALDLAEKGEHVAAVTEFSELFSEAEKVPETPVGLLRGPLAYVQCRLWVLALRNETLDVFPPHSQIFALAQRVGKFCTDTLSDIIAGNSTVRNGTQLQARTTWNARPGLNGYRGRKSTHLHQEASGSSTRGLKVRGLRSHGSSRRNSLRALPRAMLQMQYKKLAYTVLIWRKEGWDCPTSSLAW